MKKLTKINNPNYHNYVHYIQYINKNNTLSIRKQETSQDTLLLLLPYPCEETASPEHHILLVGSKLRIQLHEQRILQDIRYNDATWPWLYHHTRMRVK